MRQVFLVCDGEGCEEKIVASGASAEEADANLAIVAREAGWMAEALEETFAEADRRRVASDEEIVIKRNDRCPSCASRAS